MCVTTNQSDTTPNPNPNPTNKQHTLLSVQLNISHMSDISRELCTLDTLDGHCN